MNGKTAKAIRKFAIKMGVSYRHGKELWNSKPHDERAIYRDQIEQEIRDLSYWLKKWRGHTTQKEAADKLSVPLETYKNWEYGKNMPSDLALAEIKRRIGYVD